MAKDVSIIVRAQDEFTDTFKGLSSVLKGLAATLGGLALGAFFKSSIEEGIKAEDSYRRLGASVKNAGGEFSSLKPILDETVDRVQRLSNQTDDDLRGALTKLISTTGDVGGSMKNLGLVADVAAERQISLNDAAVLVGKTMNGTLTPLTKAYGVEVRTAAEGVALLHEKTDGFAKTATEGMGGALTNLKIQWGEFKKSIGLAIIGSDTLKGSTTGLADALITLQKWVKDNEDGIGSFVGLLASAVPSILDFGKSTVGVFGSIGNWIRNAIYDIEAFGLKLNIVIAGALENLGFLNKKWGEAGAKMKAQQKENLAELRNDQAVENAMLTKVVAQGQADVTKVHAQGGADRVNLTKDEKKKIEDAAKESAKKLADIQKMSDDLAYKASLEGLDAQHKAYAEMVHTFQDKMKGMNEKDAQAAQAILDDNLRKLNASWGLFHQQIVLDGKVTWATEKEGIKQLVPTVTDFNEVLKQHGVVLSEAQRKALATATAHKEFKEAAAGVAMEIAKGADALGGFLDVLGLSDEKTRKLTAGIGDLGEGISKALKGDIVGGILQGLGGIKNLIGGLFGKSEADKRLEAALDRARVRIEELRDGIGNLNLNLTGHQLAGVQGALKQFFASGGANQKGWGDRLGQLLLGQGVNESDLEEVAKTLNIELRPNGHLDPQMLRQLMQATGLVELSQFSNDFKGKLDEFTHQATVFGWTPQEQAQRLAALLSQQSPGFAGALAGADLSTSEGQAAALASLRGLEGTRAAGGLSDTQLGGLTGSEFTSELEKLIEMIGGLASAMPDIVPTGDTGDLSGLVGTVSTVPEGITAVSNLNAILSDSRDYLQSIDAQIAAWAPPLTGGAASVAGSGGVTITIEQIVVQAAAGANGTQIGEDLATALNEEFARLYQQDRLAIGSAVRA